MRKSIIIAFVLTAVLLSIAACGAKTEKTETADYFPGHWVAEALGLNEVRQTLDVTAPRDGTYTVLWLDSRGRVWKFTAYRKSEQVYVAPTAGDARFRVSSLGRSLKFTIHVLPDLVSQVTFVQ